MMKGRDFSGFKVVIILLVVMIIAVILMKGWSYIQRYYLSKIEENKISGNVTGYYTVTALAPEYLDYLMSPQGHIHRKCMFADAEYGAFMDDPEGYVAYSIDIFLDNHSDVNLSQLQIFSNNNDIYIYPYSYLMCDKPLLIANTSGVSREPAWIVIKIGNKGELIFSDILKNLELHGKGNTPHGHEYTWNIPCKLE